MDKDFVPYQPSLDMKSIGFDEPCFGQYAFKKLELINTPLRSSDLTTSEGNFIAAPTFSQAFRWFREKYQLVHEISWSKYKGGLNFDYDIFSLVLPTDDELGNEDDIYIEKPMETYDSLVDKGFKWHESDTYEQAEHGCLEKLIEIVKENGFHKNIH